MGGDSIVLAYDAGGRLARRQVIGAAPRFFLWQGDNLLAELDSVSGKVAEYSYYPGLDDPHAVIVGTTPYFAHRDGKGNVIALTDSATLSVQRSYDYDAWGALIWGNDSKPFANADRARFKGALWLGPEVDVYYMRARWYEPKSGRFLSEDPIGSGGSNLYAFGANDPVNGRDPRGLCADNEEIWVSFTKHYDAAGNVVAITVHGYFCMPKLGGGGGGSVGGAATGEETRRVGPDECPAPPRAPPSADLSRDIRKGEMFRLANGLPFNILGHRLFIAAVWNGGVMDYKGRLGLQYDNYTNFTYGAVGSAVGYTSNILMRMSGWADYRLNRNEPAHLGRALTENPPPYWDNAIDRGNIAAGIQYYQNGCH